MIQRIQQRIQDASDALLERMRAFVTRIARLLGFNVGGGEGEEAAAAEGGGIGKEVRFQAGEESHRQLPEMVQAYG